ncbi:MAG TPA: hypothetical protein VGG48_09820 [Rhizomicrobium sp.]|jgi:hypothetical protein
MPDPVETSLAESIGSQLLEGALGEASGIALGSILESAGLDPSGMGEVNAKLDKILAELEAIKTELDKLVVDLDEKLGQLSYDVAIKPIQKLVDTNVTLGKYFTALTEPGADINGLKADIATLMDADYLAGVETWHNTLCGLTGQTSVLNAWSVAVAAKATPFFGFAESQRIETQWAFFDSQQAMTVAYLIEHYNANKSAQTDSSIVLDTLRTWQQNRVTQLQMLRGMTRQYDDFPILGDDGKATTVRTPLSFLPQCTLLWHRPEGNWLMLLTGGEMSPLQVTYKSNPYFRGEPGPGDRRTPNAPAMTGMTGWDMTDVDIAVEFLNTCMPFAITNDSDRPLEALLSRGFLIDPKTPNFRVWTIDRGLTQYSSNYLDGNNHSIPLWFFVSFTENNDWEHPVVYFNELGFYLLRRDVGSQELANYFHQS